MVFNQQLLLLQFKSAMTAVTTDKYTYPGHPFLQHKLDVAVRLFLRGVGLFHGVHGKARQLAGELKHVVVLGAFVPYQRLDVQVNRNILQTKG